MNEAEKYTTVEGHPVVCGGEYELRGNGEDYPRCLLWEKVKIVALIDALPGGSKIIGYSDSKDPEGNITGIITFDWRSDGGASRSLSKSVDLMRPWKDKPDAEGCSNIDNHAGYMHIDLEKCKVCGDKWVKPDAEGWIKWDLVCPIGKKTIVEVKYEDGITAKGEAGEFYWGFDNHGTIKSYRIVEEPKKPEKQNLKGYYITNSNFEADIQSLEVLNLISDWAELHLKTK